MIEQSLREHLTAQKELAELLTTYEGRPAVFSQNAPADGDNLWGNGPHYNRVVFAEDMQGDPERTMGGTLVVDIMCAESDENQYFPEDIEPIVRKLIDGWFFAEGLFTVAAQWKTSSYFTEPTDKVTGCTVTFELLAFPISNYAPHVVTQFNEFASSLPRIHVINHEPLPQSAWKPQNGESAIYWRIATERQSSWIPSTYSTLWKTAIVKGYIFSETPAEASETAWLIASRLYTSKRLKKGGQLLRAGESPIIVNTNNTVDNGADPLRTGQLTVEATYGVIVCEGSGEALVNINTIAKGDSEWQKVKNPKQ
jgi:hypothetical protein